MVGKINEIVDNYEKPLQEMPFIPRGSFRRRMLRQDGGQNTDFLTYLFCDSGLAMQFLKDVGLLRSKVQCKTSSLTPTGTCALCPLLLTATRDHTNGHLLLQVSVLLLYVIPMTSLPPLRQGYNAGSAPHYIRDGGHLGSRNLKYIPKRDLGTI